MTKAVWARLSTFVMLFVFLTGVCAAPQSTADGRKKTVDKFLLTWLVRKDITSALKFFHEKALADEFALSCDCCGEVSISESERQNPEAINQKVRLFLTEYSHQIKGRALNEIIFLRSKENPELSDELAGKFRNRALNQPKRDKYYLVDYRENDSKAEASKHFGERYDLKGAFFSFIQYRVLNEDVRYGDDIIVHLLWARDMGEWKIINVGVVCN